MVYTFTAGFIAVVLQLAVAFGKQKSVVKFIVRVTKGWPILSKFKLLSNRENSATTQATEIHDTFFGKLRVAAFQNGAVHFWS